MDGLLQDLRFSVRLLIRNPAVAGTVILMLALGIGANTAVFSVINAVFFRPLPFRNPSGLVLLGGVWARPFPGGPKMGLDLSDWQTRREIFDEVSSYSSGGLNLEGPQAAHRIGAALVTLSFFRTLGIQPALGRTFVKEDSEPGHGNEVLLSDGLWRSVYGRDAGVVGRTVVLNKRPYLVVGVMPPGFSFPGRTAVWLPRTVPDDPRTLDMFESGMSETVIGRVADGLSVAQAQTRARGLSQAFRLDHPLPAGFQEPPLTLNPLRQSLMGDARRGLLVLFGAVALTLLLACANIATLLVAQASSRQHEMAVRVALGASPTRLLRLSIVESAILAGIGAAVGLLLGQWIQTGLQVLVPIPLLQVVQPHLDASMLAYTALLALVTVLLFGLVPALGYRHDDLHSALKQGGYHFSGGRMVRMRNLLSSVEIALALGLLVCAGLLLRSFYYLSQVDPGFSGDRVITARVSLPGSKTAEARQYYSSLLQTVGAVPGVEAVGAVNALPLDGNGQLGYPFQVIGQEPVSSGTQAPIAEELVVTPNYFRTLSIPVLRGRAFSDQDDSGAPAVAIVNESMAKRYWPRGSPLGAQVTFFPTQDVRLTIVGVVADVHDATLGQQVWENQLYLPFAQDPFPYMTVTVQASSPGLRIAPEVRRAAANVDPSVPLYDVRTMADVTAASVAPQRVRSLFICLAGVLAATLAVVGVYGAVAQLVADRTREIGVRMALGAGQNRVITEVMVHGMKLTAFGIAIGVLLAWAGSTAVNSLLFEVRRTDPITFVAASLLLAAASLLACYFPARRAAQIDPILALKGE
jgi:putative ABC transport system permease protein